MNCVHPVTETIVWGKICHYKKKLKEETLIYLVSLQPFLTAGSSESKVKWTDLPQFVSMQLKAASSIFNVYSLWSQEAFYMLNMFHLRDLFS